jgi:hypothetical protein
MDWLVATPAWGERCVYLFINKVLPAIKAAAARSSGKVRFLIHTDAPKQIKNVLAPPLENHRVIPLPKGERTTHAMLGETHRAAIAHARQGECIAFINADMIPSIEVFEAAERRFAEGKRMIIMAATRTLGGEPPIGANSADLLRWTMTNQHPIIRECFWGSGRSTVPWAIYFKRGDDIVLHGFHLHPFAVMKGIQDLSFVGKTIDRDLANNFKKHEIHLVTDADEASFAELSPAAPLLKLDTMIDVELASRWAKKNANSYHRWFFRQRIAICGDGNDIGDGEICEEILQGI